MTDLDDPYAARTLPDDAHQPQPVKHPHTLRSLLGKLVAPIIVAIGLLVKFSAFALKFFGIFISVAAYALIWGLSFAVGFVLLILVHELGHYLEARRQGLRPSLPVFVPFLGAYVAIKDAPFNPWRNGLVSIAGPIAGGAAALGVLVAGEILDSGLLRALAYTGFFLNLFNLAPLWILDGGFIWRSWKLLRHGAGARTPEEAKRLGWILGGGYILLALLLIAGMVYAHVPQERL